MKRTQLYLDEEILKLLAAVSRQRKVTMSSLVRECIRERLGGNQDVDKAALAREIGGIWKRRKDLEATEKYVRRLRKGTRLKGLVRG